MQTKTNNNVILHFKICYNSELLILYYYNNYNYYNNYSKFKNKYKNPNIL